MIKFALKLSTFAGTFNTPPIEPHPEAPTIRVNMKYIHFRNYFFACMSKYKILSQLYNSNIFCQSYDFIVDRMNVCYLEIRGLGGLRKMEFYKSPYMVGSPWFKISKFKGSTCLLEPISLSCLAPCLAGFLETDISVCPVIVQRTY